MKLRGQAILGIGIIVMGVLFLAGSILNVNLWNFVWPLLLIGGGLWLLTRPQAAASEGFETHSTMFIADVNRKQEFTARDEAIWAFVADMDLDFSSATIPEGETTYRLNGFVGDVNVTVPPGVGVTLHSSAVVNDISFIGHGQDSFLEPVKLATDDYATAARKLRLETAFFVADVKVKRAGSVVKGV